MPNEYATVNFSELDYFLKRSKFCDGWLLYWVRYALFAFFAAQRTFIHRSEIGPLSTLVDCVVRTTRAVKAARGLHCAHGERQCGVVARRQLRVGLWRMRRTHSSASALPVGAQ